MRLSDRTVIATGGAAGMPVPPFRIFGLTLATGSRLYYVIIPTTALLHLIVRNVMQSRFGRALSAIRQSETAAEAMGVDVLRYKAAAFAASGFDGARQGATGACHDWRSWSDRSVREDVAGS